MGLPLAKLAIGFRRLSVWLSDKIAPLFRRIMYIPRIENFKNEATHATFASEPMTIEIKSTENEKYQAELLQLLERLEKEKRYLIKALCFSWLGWLAVTIIGICFKG